VTDPGIEDLVGTSDIDAADVVDAMVDPTVRDAALSLDDIEVAIDVSDLSLSNTPAPIERPGAGESTAAVRDALLQSAVMPKIESPRRKKKKKTASAVKRIAPPSFGDATQREPPPLDFADTEISEGVAENDPPRLHRHERRLASTGDHPAASRHPHRLLAEAHPRFRAAVAGGGAAAPPEPRPGARRGLDGGRAVPRS